MNIYDNECKMTDHCSPNFIANRKLGKSLKEYLTILGPSTNQFVISTITKCGFTDTAYKAADCYDKQQRTTSLLSFHKTRTS
jgi:hypothetical protein